jgi:serine/threonine protein kinase
VAGGEPIPGYRLVKRLGQGGFGEVWQATGPGGFTVALKFIRLETSASEFELRSLELMKNIRHPNLLVQFGAWQCVGTLVIAMELADDTLLNRLADAVGEGLSGIPADELLEYMADAARGIDYLNEPRPADGQPHGIQHRDIKPANLLRVGGRVKVADFGLAKLLDHTLASNSGSLTPAYAAPEFFQGETSAHSDQYSLAVSYCQLRGNRLPFRGSKEQVMMGHLTNPPDLGMLPPAEQAVVARALCKKPEGRWPSCGAFAQALALATRPQPAPVVVPPPPEPDSGPANKSGRRPALWDYRLDRRLLPYLWFLLAACVALWFLWHFGEVMAAVRNLIEFVIELLRGLFSPHAPPPGALPERPWD